MRIANRIRTLGAQLAVCYLAAGCAPGSIESEPLAQDAAELEIVTVKCGWLVPTEVSTEGGQQKLFVAIAKEDVRAGKASVVGATLADPGVGKNPFGHPEGFYRIQHHSRLPLAADPRVRVFVADNREMQDARMITLLPDPSATQDGRFAFGSLEGITNASHQLGVGLGTNAEKKAELLSLVQARYDHVASIEGLPPVKLHYELDIGVLARIGFNANDPLTGTLNRNQPILVADRIRSIIAGETVESEDPDLTTAKPCNGPVPGEPTPDPTQEPPTGDDVSEPVL